MNDRSVIERPWPRNAGIDLLRGLSILLVVLHHIGLRLPLKASALGDFVPKPILSAMNWNGYEAVFVFFVISGYLIASHSLRRWARLAAIDLRAFWLRRAARIVPCLVLLVAVLAALHALGAEDYVIHRDGQSLGRAVVAAFGLHLNWYEGVTGYLPGGWDVLWSLSIEEVFYLGFPLLCLCVRSERLLLALLAVLALSLPATRAALAGNEIWQEKAYLPGMAAIATGVIAAILAARWPRRSARLDRVLVVVGALGLASVLFVEGWWWALIGNGVMLILTGAVGCLVVGLDREGRRALPGTAWLRSFGRLSYEIYLGHMFIVFALVASWKASGLAPYWSFLAYVPGVLGAWALGALVERTWSLPWERRLRQRSTTSDNDAASRVALAPD